MECCALLGDGRRERLTVLQSGVPEGLLQMNVSEEMLQKASKSRKVVAMTIKVCQIVVWYMSLDGLTIRKKVMILSGSGD